MKITLCGSYAFQEDMEQIAKRLIDRGHEVQLPELPTESKLESKDPLSIRAYIEEFGDIDAIPADHPVWQAKAKAIDNHFDKIAWADGILVVNNEKKGIVGYIGGNTLMEIAVARRLGKKIYIWNPISSELSYKEEILGIKPLFLHRDMKNIV